MTNQERIENMGCQFVYLVLFAHPCKLHVNPNKGLEKYGKIMTNQEKKWKTWLHIFGFVCPTLQTPCKSKKNIQK